MNYEESQEILKKVKHSKRIFIACHNEPDADAIGSLLGFGMALKKLGYKITIGCKDEVPGYLSFLPKQKVIKVIDYEKLQFEGFDLIIALDSSVWERIVGSELIEMPKAPVIVIDHHRSNIGYGEVNLIDAKSTSTSEIIYKILKDWKVRIEKNIATALLTGIIGDTGSFKYPGITGETFQIAAELMNSGADRDEIIFHLFFSVKFDELKYLAEVLKVTSFDKKNKIVWAAVPYTKFVSYGKLDAVGFAGSFFQVVEGTNIGILMVEKEKDVIDVSFRGRKDMDVSKIAVSLGGGGHKKAAGVKLRDIKFEDAVKKVLRVAKKYSNQ